MKYSHFRALKWFRVTVAFAFITTLPFALTALITPRFLEGLLEVGVSNTPHWLQNVGVLLVIISVMYIPVFRDPFRYIFVTYLAVAGRFAAGTLFLIGFLFVDYPEGMRLLAANDLILSSIQAVLLFFVLRAGDPRSGQLSTSQI